MYPLALYCKITLIKGNVNFLDHTYCRTDVFKRDINIRKLQTKNSGVLVCSSRKQDVFLLF